MTMPPDGVDSVAVPTTARVDALAKRIDGVADAATAAERQAADAEVEANAATTAATSAAATAGAASAAIQALTARVAKLESGPVIPPPSPTPAPLNAVFDAVFGTGGNATQPAADIIAINGKPQWRAYGPGYNETYGMGTGGKIQSSCSPANVKLTDAGLVLTGKMAPAGAPQPAVAAFLGTRDVSNAAEQFPFPLYGTFTIDCTPNAYVQDFDAVWLRHRGGSSVGEIDFFETMAADLGGDQALQFGVPQLGGGASYVLYRARYKVAAGVRVKIVMVHKPTTGTSAQLSVTINGVKPYQTVTNVTNPTPIVDYVYDRTKLEAATPDKAHAWDIALQSHKGFTYGADVTKPYTGTLRNGSAGKPLGGTTRTWDDNTPPKTSTLTIHRITVESL